MLKKRILRLAAAAFVPAILAVLLIPTNGTEDRLTLVVVGCTNSLGTTHLIVCLPKSLKRPYKPPFGHKGYYFANVDLNFELSDGTTTNVVWREDVAYGWPSLNHRGPHVDLTFGVEIPQSTKSIHITKGETVVGSFQDLKLPFNQRSRRTTFIYETPDKSFAVSELARLAMVDSKSLVTSR